MPDISTSGISDTLCPGETFLPGLFLCSEAVGGSQFLSIRRIRVILIFNQPIDKSSAEIIPFVVKLPCKATKARGIFHMPCGRFPRLELFHLSALSIERLKISIRDTDFDKTPSKKIKRAQTTQGKII